MGRNYTIYLFTTLLLFLVMGCNQSSSYQNTKGSVDADKLKPAFSIVLKDLFYEWNITATNQQKQYKTRITEIDNKINGAKFCGLVVAKLTGIFTKQS